MSQQSQELPMVSWECENLRLTAFPVHGTQSGDIDWWTELTGDSPETETNQPKRGIWVQEGSYASGHLILRVHPVRIDWVFAAEKVEPEELGDVPQIGPFSEVSKMFTQLLSRWLESDACPPVRRLAFGAILVDPAEDRVDGYRKMNGYLPSVELDVEGSSDFLYQINRQRQSETAPDLLLNRLTKWSIAAWRLATLARGTDKPVTERYYCRLELDLSTAVDFEGELLRAQLSSIFAELVELSKEIADKGDVP